MMESKCLSSAERWTYIKREITFFCKQFSKNNAQERSLIISQLSEKLMELEYHTNDLFQADQKVLLDTKSDLEEVLQE